ncbi:mitochondrial assembly of ribosomal large subunit protein 1 [Ictalurus punctatus]|uniref:Mitochondrial assembly of ribosomal large subunit protein 1 n=1 Tax=Ictalurus punctatus TaxID=7998 RepID=A0A2D0QNL2_ICTPU|nr:mitochondrial assembly of ribosomal large subunit protein 1 [Ictalurus punctatus]
MAALGCRRCVFTRLFNMEVCYRVAGLHSLTNTHNTARFSRYLRKTRALSRALFSNTDGSDVELTARDSYTQQQLQHGGAVFNLGVLVSVLREENAVDICVIRVPDQLRYTDYFIIVSGSSTRHLRAMALYTIKVYKFLRRETAAHTHIEGQHCDDWMCIDFGSMVVHFMLPETREKFQLETLWTLRSYEQLTNNTLPHTLPPDFILTHTHTD